MSALTFTLERLKNKYKYKLLDNGRGGRQLVEPGNPFWGGRLGTVYLLALISSDQLLFKLKICFFTNQTILTRMSIVLSLPVQVGFHGWVLDQCTINQWFKSSHYLVLGEKVSEIITENYRNLQKIPKNYRKLKKITEIYRNLQKFTEIFRNFQKFSEIFRNFQKLQKIAEKFTEIYRNLQKFTEIYRNLQKFTENIKSYAPFKFPSILFFKMHGYL